MPYDRYDDQDRREWRGQRDDMRGQYGRGQFGRGQSGRGETGRSQYERGQYGSERGWGDHSRGQRDDMRGHDSDRDRGWIERAGDEIASWFGDDDLHGDRPRGDRDRDDRFARQSRPSGRDRDARDDDDMFMRPNAGRSQGGYGRDPYDRNDSGSRGSFGSSGRSQNDPHYHEWRRRQVEELDRDYDDYRRERQSSFESDFGQWRGRRQEKRGLLGRIREHMEVVGSDGDHVGTVDRVAGERIILTKSDPDADGVHHSMSCTDVDRIDDNKVILDLDAKTAKQRWRDENRERALFEREDQGEAGPHMLDRSFSGTYR